MNGPSQETTQLDAIADPEPRTARSSAAEPATAEEVEQLEALLGARAKELTEQRAELARLRGLLRDAATRLETSAGASAEQVIAELRRERDQAVARALESEAARAEIGFRLDEVMGHLAAAGAAERALPGERMDQTSARLAGTVRGLVSSLAETQESRETAQARLLLAEQDLLELRAEARTLERERAELREQLELEQLKARRTSEHWRGGLDAPAAACLRGERDGLRARSEEGERAFAATAARIAELEQVVARETASRAEVGSALAQAQAERMVLLEELERARAVKPDLRTERHAEALRAVRAELNELAAALRGAHQRKGNRGSLGPIGDDPEAAGATTSIEPVESLELQLAASEARLRHLEARLASAAATVGGLEASAASPGAAQQLAALRVLLERR
jgi:hypothetical protein